MVRKLAVIVCLLGVVGIILGGVYIGLGVNRNAQLKEAMRVEHISLGIEGIEEDTGQVIDSYGEAKAAGDIIREHRRGIAATYEDLLGGERFDPANLTQLTYAQALNLENYLYLSVVAFGLAQSVIASGVYMVVIGIAIGGTGIGLFWLAKTPRA